MIQPKEKKIKNILPIYFLFVLSLLIFSGASSAEAMEVGTLSFNPLTVSSGDTLNIILSGVSATIPDNTVTRLWIDKDEGSGYSGAKDFGSWVTVGDLKRGIKRIISCNKSKNYTPGETVSLSGKLLKQQLYLTYEGTGQRSNTVTYTTDCRGASEISMKLLKLLPDYTAGGKKYTNMGAFNADVFSTSKAGLTTNVFFTYYDYRQNNNGTVDWSYPCMVGYSKCIRPNSLLKSYGNKTGRRVFSLEDPMNPKIQESGTIWDIDTDNDQYGDAAVGLRTRWAVTSDDGEYSAITNSQYNLFAQQKGGSYRYIVNANGGERLVGIIKAGANTYLIGKTGVYNMTNLKNQPIVQATGVNRFSSNQSYFKDMPPNTPNSKNFSPGDGDENIVLGDTFARVVFGYAAGKDSTNILQTPKLEMYSFNQSSPVISYPLPSSVLGVGLMGLNWLKTGLVTPDGKKYVILGSDKKIFIYQVSLDGKTFIPIAENLTIPNVSLVGSAYVTWLDSTVGVVINGEPAVMIFNTDKGTVNPKIFKFSDLKEGIVKNVPARVVGGGISKVQTAAAYIKGNTTYVYTSSGPGYGIGGSKQIAVWDLSGVH